MKRKVKQQTRLLKRVSTMFPVLVLLVLVGAIYGLSETIKEEKIQMAAEKMKVLSAEPPPANVVVLDVLPTTMLDQINLPGIIEPWEKLSVMAKIQGSVIEMKVCEGEKVTKGQVIARLDPADYLIALDSARADFELATANQKRMANLFDKKIIPAAEMEEIEAQKKTSKARLDKAQLLLSRCEITSPISGVIQHLDAKEGLLLNVFDPIAEILKINKVKAVVGIPESDVALVRNIKEVPLTIQALDDKEIIGRFHFLASSPDTSARLYRLELEIDNEDNHILPGMFFRAQVVKRVIKDTIAVPLFSVIKRQDEQYVFVEEDGVARQLPVELGIIVDWQVQVIEGITPGNRIVVEGHRDIDQGHKLNVVRVISTPQEVLL
jgi:membrane fusion protein (multidrug efflux system)